MCREDFSAMSSALVVIRNTTMRDAELIYAWRNHPDIRLSSHNTDEIDLGRHLDWMENALINDRICLLMGEVNKNPIGVVRFDLQEDTSVISIYLTPHHMGRGLGIGLLRAGHDWLAVNKPTIRIIQASIKPDNIRSQKTFLKAGYIQQGDYFVFNNLRSED